MPYDWTNLVGFRQAIGEAGVEELPATTIAVAADMKALAPDDFKRVIVDSTVREKAIAFPTDSQLVEPRAGAEFSLKQTYEREGKRLRRRAGGYAHAKQYKRLGLVLKRKRTILGHVLRGIERKITSANETHPVTSKIWLAPAGGSAGNAERTTASCTRQRGSAAAKAKPGNRTSGVKAGLAITAKSGLIVSARIFPGNPYDVHTLAAQLEQTCILLENILGDPKPTTTLINLGYRGVGAEVAPVKLIHRGKHKTLSDRQWKRRQAVEPVIGHVKVDHGLRRCWLKGAIGDTLRVVLCSAGFKPALVAARDRQGIGIKPIWLHCLRAVQNALHVFASFAGSIMRTPLASIARH
ncbi:transposase [Burkholderia sp. JSH-S8]|nr:transposase [Burkholderia sp. JSH-S8]